MAKTYEVAAVWNEINPTTLSAKSQALYATLRELRKAKAIAQAAFEDNIRTEAELPQGYRMVFGYRFGKLSAAVVPDEGKPERKATKPTMSLAQFMQVQQLAGARA